MSSLPSLDRAVEELRAHPDRPVRVRVEGGLVIELRALGESATTCAADAFAAIGPWEGESLDDFGHGLQHEDWLG